MRVAAASRGGIGALARAVGGSLDAEAGAPSCDALASGVSAAFDSAFWAWAVCVNNAAAVKAAGNRAWRMR